jgi:hypothetical protein
LKSPKVSLKAIEQEIDLSEFFPGVDFSGERALKEAIGQAIIDRIASRTEAGDSMSFGPGGQGRPGTLKSPYSKGYQKSLQFKAAGKKATKVNMELTGDMVASMDLEIGSDGKFKVVLPEDQVPKAYNHITGDTVPKRPWFGISKGELNDILDGFRPDIEMAENAPGLNDAFGKTSLAAIDALGDEGED